MSDTAAFYLHAQVVEAVGITSPADNSTSTAANKDFATFHGYLATTDDAWILLEACRVGLLRKVTDRPPTMRVPKAAKKLAADLSALTASHVSASPYSPIRSGTIIVFDCSANIKRWRDGKKWTASRISGAFLTYSERSDPEHKGCLPTDMAEETRLIKRTLAATLNGKKFHVVSYYTRADLNAKRLETPSHWAAVNNLRLDKTRWASQAAIAGGWNSKVKRPPRSLALKTRTSAVSSRAPPPPPPKAPVLAVSSTSRSPVVQCVANAATAGSALFPSDASVCMSPLPSPNPSDQLRQQRQYRDTVVAAATVIPQFIHSISSPATGPLPSPHDTLWHGTASAPQRTHLRSATSSSSLASSSLMPPQKTLPYVVATSPFSSSSSTCSSTSSDSTTRRYRQTTTIETPTFPSPPPSTAYSGGGSSADNLFFDSYHASPLDALVSLQLPTPMGSHNQYSGYVVPPPPYQQQQTEHHIQFQQQQQQFAATTMPQPQPQQRDLDHEFLMQLFGMDDLLGSASNNTTSSSTNGGLATDASVAAHQWFDLAYTPLPHQQQESHLLF
ncbi:hypothetical protein HDU87_004647 [Geranomyces variabilis]|uniref:Casein kinase 1 gamma C-terminal domain-containing protein n=1 Tax=Geranomyces variabilis TaxID=109894 RepID=A0AAD5XMC7_9FUNG|nr:hypothetical protein HDU87_004647 [Geranomyces variabilis]